MADTPSSSWDDLIKQIGAEPAPDALERKRPAIETQFTPPPAVELPRPKGGDWNALAGALGIEVPAEPEPRPSSPPAAAAPAEKTPPSAPPTSAQLEATFARIEPMESMFEEIIEDEISDIEFTEVEEPTAQGDDTPAAQDPSSEALSGDAARNAFEALFQAGSFSALPPTRPAPRPKGQERRGPTWRELEEDNEKRRSAREAQEEDQLEVDGGDVDDASEEVTEEQDRPKRRRRRRRGRTKERGPAQERGPEDAEADSSEQDVDEWPAALEDEEPVLEGDAEQAADESESGEAERPRRRRVRRRRRRGKDDEEAAERPVANGRSPSANANVEDSDDDDDEGEDAAAISGEDQDDDGEEISRAAHKNIPTWSDAIGVMVELNLQSRKNSPQRPSGPRGDRGRGRGRGGRGGRRGR